MITKPTHKVFYVFCQLCSPGYRKEIVKRILMFRSFLPQFYVLVSVLHLLFGWEKDPSWHIVSQRSIGICWHPGCIFAMAYAGLITEKVPTCHPKWHPEEAGDIGQQGIRTSLHKPRKWDEVGGVTVQELMLFLVKEE